MTNEAILERLNDIRMLHALADAPGCMGFESLRAHRLASTQLDNLVAQLGFEITDEQRLRISQRKPKPAGPPNPYATASRIRWMDQDMTLEEFLRGHSTYR